MGMMKSLAGLIVLLALWWVVSTYLVAAPYFLPTPQAALQSYREPMLTGAIATTARSVFAFALGSLLAYGLYGLFSSIGMARNLDEQFAATRAIPMVAATPLFILWFGFGEFARLLVTTLTVAAFVIGPLAEAVHNLPREQMIIRKRLEKSRLWEFIWIVVPGTLSAMIGPLRIAYAVGFTTAIAVDFMGSTVGIGRAIDSARVTFNTPAIFLLLILSALIGVVLDKLLGWSLKTLCHWRSKTSKG